MCVCVCVCVCVSHCGSPWLGSLLVCALSLEPLPDMCGLTFGVYVWGGGGSVMSLLTNIHVPSHTHTHTHTHTPQMVWEQNVSVVVMLTTLIDIGLVSPHEYH